MGEQRTEIFCHLTFSKWIISGYALSWQFRYQNYLKLPLSLITVCFITFLAVNWAYVGQPDNHIGWEKSMPVASIDPTHPRTNFWNFGENCSAFGGGWKTQFFWVGHFEIFLLFSYLN